MSMMDRLRESALEEDDELFGAELEGDIVVPREQVEERRILGMNAAERMVLSILMFLATSVLGTLILIALNRIDIGL